MGARTRGVHRAAATAAGVLLAAIVFGGWSPAAADTPTPEATIAANAEPASFICGIARSHIREGEYDAAVTLIESSPADVRTACEDELAAATSLAAAAEARDEKAKEAAEKTAADNPGATFGKAWDAFVKEVLTPLSGVAIFVAGGWLALFVLARLSVELKPFHDLTSSRAERTVAAVAGWVLLAIVPPVAALMSVSAATAEERGLGLPLTVAAVGVAALALICVAALAFWLATLLRLEIVVTPRNGDVKTALDAPLIASMLRELSSESAGSRIELPVGTDVAELGTSLQELSDIKWIAAVQKILLFVVGFKAWTANVTVSSERAATVTLIRHSRTLISKPLTTKGAGLEALDKPADRDATAEDFLAASIAAFIVSGLRERYPDDFAPGLYGATKGRSIWLQYVASRWFTTGLENVEATTLLRAALKADPANLGALVTLHWVLYRAGTRDQLKAYAQWLDARITTEEGAAGINDAKRWFRRSPATSPLLLRLYATRAAIGRNLAALSEPGAAEAALQKTTTWRDLLLDRANRRAATPEARARCEIDVAALTAAPVRTYPPYASPLPADLTLIPEASPFVAYSLACFRARWTATCSYADVAELLDLAFTVDQLREFAPSDPELKELAADSGFKKATAEVAPGAFDVWPFDEKSKKWLTGNDELKDEKLLAAAEWEDSFSPHVSKDEFRRWRSVARGMVAARPLGSPDRRYAVISFLHQAGITDVSRLRFLHSGDGEHLRLAIRAYIERSLALSLSDAELVAWLKNLDIALVARS